MKEQTLEVNSKEIIKTIFEIIVNIVSDLL